MQRIKFFLMLLCFPFMALSQVEKPVRVFNRVNDVAASYANVYYDFTRTFVSMVKGDTSVIKGRIWIFYFKYDTSTNKKFIIKTPAVTHAYDGDSLYTILHNSKEVGIKNAIALQQKGGVQKVVFDYLWINYVTKNKKIRIDNIDSVALETNRGNIIATLSDSIVNELKSTTNKIEKGYIKTVYEINAVDYTIKRYEYWTFLLKTPQYVNMTLSPMIPLDKETTFKQILNIDSLFRAGYKRVIPSTNPKVNYSLKINDTIPNFSLPSAGYDTIRYTDIKEPFLLLDFWYMSCAPCIQSIPHTDSIYQKYRQGKLYVLGINHDSNTSKLKSFIEENQVYYPVAIDKNRNITSRFGVHAFPTFILVHVKSRKVIFIKEGFSNNMVSIIEKAIAEYDK